MISNYTANDVLDQTGKTFVITGANTGLGFEAALALAQKGARVVLACRTRSKADAACEHIRGAHPDADLGIVDLDLSDLASVRAAAAQIAKEPRIDGLLNNAGIMMPATRQTTKDGFEAQLGVNHFGHFALTGLLLPALQATEASRVVTTSSLAHKSGDIHFDDLDAERKYSPLGRYGQSKLANLLFTHELDRRLRAAGSTTISVGVHPGGSKTELDRNLGGLMKLMIPIMKPFMGSAAEGAWSTLLGATAPGVEGGMYFGPGGFGEMRGPAKEVACSKRSRDEALAKRLWDVSVERTGIDPGI